MKSLMVQIWPREEAPATAGTAQPPEKSRTCMNGITFDCSLHSDSEEGHCPALNSTRGFSAQRNICQTMGRQLARSGLKRVYRSMCQSNSRLLWLSARMKGYRSSLDRIRSASSVDFQLDWNKIALCSTRFRSESNVGSQVN